VPLHRMRLPHAKITIAQRPGDRGRWGRSRRLPGREPLSAPGPVAAHGFDGTGPRLADASGNVNDGATTASRTRDGRLGRALNLDGSTAAAVIPDDASGALRHRPARALLRGHEERWLRQGGADHRGDRPGRRAPRSLIGPTLTPV
jgi:hypothetical protein